MIFSQIENLKPKNNIIKKLNVKRTRYSAN